MLPDRTGRDDEALKHVACRSTVQCNSTEVGRNTVPCLTTTEFRTVEDICTVPCFAIFCCGSRFKGATVVPRLPAALGHSKASALVPGGTVPQGR